MKSKKIILTAMLLSAVLISSCFMATTVANYKTVIATATGTARVAKWGFEEKTGVALNLFANTYKNSNNKIIASSSNTDNIIAPGFSSSATITFTNPDNTPEVNYKLNYEVSVAGISDEVKALINSGAIILKVDNVSKTITGNTIYTSSAIYAAGTLPAHSPSINISWEWVNSSASFVDDTAAGNSETSLSLPITVSLIAEQTFDAPATKGKTDD